MKNVLLLLSLALAQITVFETQTETVLENATSTEVATTITLFNGTTTMAGEATTTETMATSPTTTATPIAFTSTITTQFPASTFTLSVFPTSTIELSTTLSFTSTPSTTFQTGTTTLTEMPTTTQQGGTLTVTIFPTTTLPPNTVTVDPTSGSTTEVTSTIFEGTATTTLPTTSGVETVFQSTITTVFPSTVLTSGACILCQTTTFTVLVSPTQTFTRVVSATLPPLCTTEQPVAVVQLCPTCPFVTIPVYANFQATTATVDAQTSIIIAPQCPCSTFVTTVTTVVSGTTTEIVSSSISALSTATFTVTGTQIEISACSVIPTPCRQTVTFEPFVHTRFVGWPVVSDISGNPLTPTFGVLPTGGMNSSPGTYYPPNTDNPPDSTGTGSLSVLPSSGSSTETTTSTESGISYICTTFVGNYAERPYNVLDGSSSVSQSTSIDEAQISVLGESTSSLYTFNFDTGITEYCDMNTTVVVCQAETCTKSDREALGSKIDEFGECTIHYGTISTVTDTTEKGAANVKTPNWVPYAAALLAGGLGLLI